ncbi:MAG: Zn-ribbon domain-containing OB-fold protein [Methylibium sp.]|uniref:Zn-ribbon domain-containing OB-fold protein n=1 Tax=Methylibium sp. TaxID=2067992 RepID=UPI00180ECCCF|nr:Zn-ribbon domain-containing OB-fold protein [Methylibium sp.]MBA2721801.1 Zn-ribbon domain-containing OB-fold protein [Methylibium sp.]MBA3597166.1 Zn-ribbon domain-containing OB-fold protein [Methylibium sp.]
MTETALSKPLPVITDLTRPFWTGAKNGKLMLQKCPRCATFNFHPKPWCIECGSRELAWTEAKPFGTVYSYTVSRSVAMNFSGWQAELPVLMCLIDLDDGARMYGQVTHCKPDELRIGMRVEAYFEAISEEAGIPKFRPSQQAAPEARPA